MMCWYKFLHFINPDLWLKSKYHQICSAVEDKYWITIIQLVAKTISPILKSARSILWNWRVHFSPADVSQYKTVQLNSRLSSSQKDELLLVWRDSIYLKRLFSLIKLLFLIILFWFNLLSIIVKNSYHLFIIFVV